MRPAIPYVSRWFAATVLAASAFFAQANTATEPAGHTIGSAGFNDMLAKQTGAGTFATEAQADGSFLLKNTMQTVSARITPQGTQFDSIGNSAGKGGFGLSITQWGRENALQVAESSKIYTDGDVVYHTHTNGIAEKFSNTNDGIRQDFIIPIKPAGSGALQVQLQVNGATVEQKNDGAVIAMESGRRLTYNHLQVTDSNNHIIPAQLQVVNNSITIAVDDSNAQYPLTIDPTVGDENWVSMVGFLGANGKVNALVYKGSTLYVGGSFTVIGGVAVNYIAQWNGSSWSALGSGMNGYVKTLAVDGSGNLYAGGEFTMAGGVGAIRIAKWNGSSWSGLGLGVDSFVEALAVDNSGMLYAGGYFSQAGGVTVSRIAKWNGSNWSSLAGGTNSTVYALVVDNNGKLYAGGAFTTAGGVSANRVAKWNGSSWSAVGSGFDRVVYELAMGGNGTLYAAGNFSLSGGVTLRGNVAKWNGSSWSGLGFLNMVLSLAVDGSGNLYAGGTFTTAGGVAANSIAKWNGSSWSALGSGMDKNVTALAMDSSGTLYAGGDFTIAGGKPSDYLATWVGAVDTDHDGIPNDVDPDDDGDGLADAVDNCQFLMNPDQINADADSQGDSCDSDDDNDGVADVDDAFPLDSTESLDTDHDGIGNNADLDDDGDGVPDYIDADPLNAAIANERSLLFNAPYKGSSVREAAAVQ